MAVHRNKICGWMLGFSVLFSIYASINHSEMKLFSGVLIWLSALFFLNTLNKGQIKQVVILIFIGLLGLSWGLMHHQSNDYLYKALEANQSVVTMLIAVGFLKVFLNTQAIQGAQLPTGKKSLIQTLFGTHILGSVINMSAVIIVGDRLAQKQQLKTIQGAILLRAFTICNLWSPFFATMGLTLICAPGARISTILLYTIPLSVSALLLTSWAIYRTPEVQNLSGYPIKLGTLWMPILLAITILSIHAGLPDLNIITVVSLTSIVFAVIRMICQHGPGFYHDLINHIETGICNSKGEVVVFSAAALLASGVAAFTTSLHLHLAPDHFGALAACVTLALLVGLAMLGMHPVTSVSLAGSLLAPSVQDPNLLAMTLLMGWSIGITMSPLSGVQLSIQSRYSISAKQLLRHNIPYGIGMLCLCFTVLTLYTHL